MTKKTSDEKATTRRHVHEAEASVGGALVGAAVGAIAGPPGAIAGAIFGGLVGAMAATAAEDTATDRERTDAALDDVIGVTGGDMGAPNLEHPPASRGTYSGSSSGVNSSTESASAEGPMQAPQS